MAERIHAVTMPRWGMTMTEGTVATWLVPEGGAVAPGQDLVEIETTKITNVMEAAAGGVLRRRILDEGATAPVGALLGVVADPEAAEADIERFVAGYKAREGEAEAAAQPATAPRIVAAGRHRLNVLTIGSGDGVPLVLVHGFGGDLNAWAFNQEPLASGRAVHVIDLPAHGGSSPTIGDGTVADLADAVVAGLDALELARVHLVGHSLGGAVAIRLAASAPGRVASLALIAPVGLGPEVDQAYLDGFIAAERRKPMKEVLSRLYADPSRISSDMVEDVLRMKRLDGVPEALRAIARGFTVDGRQAIDLRAALQGLKVPILVIWGEHDRIVPPSHAEGLGGPVRVERVAAAGHMPQVEDAAAVNRLLAEHLTGADAS